MNIYKYCHNSVRNTQDRRVWAGTFWKQGPSSLILPEAKFRWTTSSVVWIGIYVYLPLRQRCLCSKPCCPHVKLIDWPEMNVTDRNPSNHLPSFYLWGIIVVRAITFVCDQKGAETKDWWFIWKNQCGQSVSLVCPEILAHAGMFDGAYTTESVFLYYVFGVFPARHVIVFKTSTLCLMSFVSDLHHFNSSQSTTSCSDSNLG